VASAEQAAREAAWRRSRLAGFVVSQGAFDEGWAAGVEYARGATVDEIVEAQGELIEAMFGQVSTVAARERLQRETAAQVIRHIKARFSPAPPAEQSGGDK
jgi:hypothetical protein